MFRAPSVYTVGELKAEYKKKVATKNRISKSKRALAGVRLPTYLETSSLIDNSYMATSPGSKQGGGRDYMSNFSERPTY